MPWHQRLLPVATVLAAVLLLWYAGCVLLNAPGAVERVLARFAARITGWNDLRTRRAGPDRFVQLRLTVPGTLTLADAHALAHEVEAAIVAEIAGVDVFVQIDVAPLPAG